MRVTLLLHGSFVSQFVLTPDAPDRRFNVINGGDRASGQVRSVFIGAPQLSALDANIRVQTGRRVTAFQGAIATFLLDRNAVALEYDYRLSPELTVRTKIFGAARNAAQVDFYDGEMLMGRLGVTQASPKAVLPNDLAMGDARIWAGATVVLTIPTKLQRGQLFLEARFQSYGIPETRFGSDVATWGP